MKQMATPETIRRRGTTATEVLVSATLLLGMIGAVVPTTVRTGKIWRDTRQYQLATNELSNQFELLSNLPVDQRTEAIEQLQVAEHVAGSLPGVELSAELISDADGNRLLLTLSWDRGQSSQPLKLVGWLPEDTMRVDDKEATDETN